MERLCSLIITNWLAILRNKLYLSQQPKPLHDFLCLYFIINTHIYLHLNYTVTAIARKALESNAVYPWGDLDDTSDTFAFNDHCQRT